MISLRVYDVKNRTIAQSFRKIDEKIGVEKDVFYQFKNLLKMDMDPSYMELLKCAFLLFCQIH